MNFEQPYLEFDQDKLESEYSPSSMIGGDISGYVELYQRLGQQARQSQPVQENISFGDWPEAVLDFFPARVPRQGLHIFIHGGYWQKLSHKDGSLLAPVMREASINFVSVNYGLSPGTRVGVMIEQISTSLRWLIDNAKTLGFDPDDITISGHSAGAHLASSALLEGRPNVPKIKRLILLSGIFDIRPTRNMSVNDALGLSEDEAEGLSLIPGPPPIALSIDVIVAENDTLEFRRQSRKYAEYLKSAGAKTSFTEYPDLDHFSIVEQITNPNHPISNHICKG